jgi:purine-binding chemotaxis protein CheW
VSSTDSLNRFLTFNLGAEEFGIPLLSVREVIAVPEFTPVPQSPPYFTGIMNLRGQVISAIDLRTRLGVKPINQQETSVIICDLSPILIGVVVDSINSVLHAEPSQVSPKPGVFDSKASEFVTSVYRKNDSLVLFLDLARALNLEDRNFARAATTKAA